MAAWDRDAAVAAYTDALTAIRSLAHEVDLTRWGDPSDLPGWSVHDVFAHVACLEALLLGRVDPPHEPDWSRLPHVGEDWVKRRMEVGVDLRRGRDPVQVRDELDEVVAQRLPQIGALPTDPDALVPGVLGKPRPVAGSVAIRTFDVWAHEQDVRRAEGLPERLTGPAAEVARQRIITALPSVVGELGLHEGTCVRWELTGALPGTVAVRVGEDQATSLEGEEEDADATMTLDWGTFALLACGRVTPSHARVTIDGDVGLAERVLDAMSITP
ncbi:MAG TPA: maleylpyruvate isomerase family mycothiol-dependent enzyme [Actinomycetes bacterium]|nr:maleylpyruvate isomerase family mycothiol-dependent enzyme [Actinomycetes bacterium]